MKGVRGKRLAIVFLVVDALAVLGVRGKIHMLKVSLVLRGENL